ncbi:zinc ribbon domain-containing protein [Spirochaeta africana]|uniref:Uncharacterized protein n=1 Tax=Spirochaeta africana (strain ATCC 700263 / DSM 8902 / Z-7692) TaxID=889378 RepID=H9UJF0_SPIAZ|nr:zinc ribbon domain-containing protein [Spirochaeta africana]AFG37643.1 hypothetical protein Spiaf_1584 [Spirochaeta africana DSM 8902]
MATQRYISTSFWDDKWVRSINPMDRYLYMYLMTNPLTNIAGVYEITIDRIAFDTGIDERSLRPMLESLSEAGKVHYYQEEWIIIPTWPKHQQYEKRSRIKEGIEKILRDLPAELLQYLIQVAYQYPVHTLLVGYEYPPNYSDSDRDTDTEGDTDAPAPPAPEDTPFPPGDEKPESGDILLDQYPGTAEIHAEIVSTWGQKRIRDYYQRIHDHYAARGTVRCQDYPAMARLWLSRDLEAGKIQRPPAPPPRGQASRQCPACGEITAEKVCPTCGWDIAAHPEESADSRAHGHMHRQAAAEQLAKMKAYMERRAG